MFQSRSVILVLNPVIISAVSLFPKVRVVNKTLMNPSASAVVQTGAGEGWILHREAEVLGLGPLHHSLAENLGSYDLRGSQCRHLHMWAILIPPCWSGTSGSLWCSIVSIALLLMGKSRPKTQLLPSGNFLVGQRSSESLCAHLPRVKVEHHQRFLRTVGKEDWYRRHGFQDHLSSKHYWVSSCFRGGWAPRLAPGIEFI